MKRTSNQRVVSKTGLGLVFGAILGMIIGSAVGELALGLIFGSGIGLMIGSALYHSSKNEISD